MVTRMNRRDAILRGVESPPAELFVQLYRHAITAYDSDPHEAHDNGRPVYRYRLTSSPSYTLAELEELLKQWRDENEATNDAQWTVSHLLKWLAKREQGKEANDGNVV